MPEPVTIQKNAESPAQTPAQTSRVERTHRLIHTASMACGIAGAVGAAGVWLAANIYVGDIEISPDKSVQSVLIKVYDKKGQDATYHLKHFQLMPGNYHLEVTADGGPAQHAEIKVEFGQKCIVPVTVKTATAGTAVQKAEGEAAEQTIKATAEPSAGAVDSSTDESMDKASEQTRKRHWWQFWRK